jgi:hypothetical protein
MSLSRQLTTALVLAAAIGLPNTAAIATPQSPSRPVVIAQSSWQEFSSEIGGFSAQLPTSPSTNKVQPRFQGKSFALNIFEAKQPAEDYLIAYADLPREMLNQGTDKLLDEFSKEVMLPALDLKKLVGHGVITSLGSHSGRIFRTTHRGRNLEARLYLSGQRIYVLMAATEKSELVDRFTNSFKLL